MGFKWSSGFHCSQHGLAPIPWRIVPNPRNFDHFTSRWTTLNWCDQVSSLDMCLGKLVFSRSTTGDRMSFFLVPFVWTGTDAVQLPQQRLETTSRPQSGSPMKKSHGNSLMSALGARFWRCEVFGEEALAPQRPWNLERACQLGSNTWKWEKKV